MSAENPQFDPNYRWIEISLRDGTPERRIRRTAEISAGHMFINPRINEYSYTFIGTRTLVLVEIEGDKDLSPDAPLALRETRERRIVRYAVAEAETPHQWLLGPTEL